MQKPSSSDSHAADGLSRRRFLRTTVAGLAGGGAVLAGCEYRTQLFLLSSVPTEADEKSPDWREARVRNYRPLGNTGLHMSDISFGAAGLDSPDLVKRALDRGINYFDTSPDYSRAGSEMALGQGIRGYNRDKLVIVSKFCTTSGHLADDAPAGKVMEAVENSLRRLQVDYLDLAHIHACNSVERLMNPNIHEAFERLKTQGKLRFLGVSSHTPRLEQVMRYAVDSGRFDVIMVAYNFRHWPRLTAIFRSAHERGVGVVAMKTLKGAKHTVLSDFNASERESFSQAAFRWVLSNPHVSGLVVTMRSFDQIDEYLHASGQPIERTDSALLEKYDRLIANRYCRPGCGECLPSCPSGVPVDDLLRYVMYYENYGLQRVGMEDYARLPAAHNASRCVDCRAPCEQACPHGLSIKTQLLRAHSQLSPV